MMIGTRKINATWTREMAEDIKYLCYFEYKFENIAERKIVEDNFNVIYSTKDSIYYSINDKKSRRRIKLLILNKDEISVIVEKILKNSISTSASDLMEMKLSEEISKEIDKEVIKGLRSLSISKNIPRYL